MTASVLPSQLQENLGVPASALPRGQRGGPVAVATFPEVAAAVSVEDGQGRAVRAERSRRRASRNGQRGSHGGPGSANREDDGRRG